MSYKIYYSPSRKFHAKKKALHYEVMRKENCTMFNILFSYTRIISHVIKWLEKIIPWKQSFTWVYISNLMSMQNEIAVKSSFFPSPSEPLSQKWPTKTRTVKVLTVIWRHFGLWYPSSSSKQKSYSRLSNVKLIAQLNTSISQNN